MMPEGYKAQKKIKLNKRLCSLLCTSSLIIAGHDVLATLSPDKVVFTQSVRTTAPLQSPAELGLYRPTGEPLTKAFMIARSNEEEIPLSNLDAFFEGITFYPGDDNLTVIVDRLNSKANRGELETININAAGHSLINLVFGGQDHAPTQGLNITFTNDFQDPEVKEVFDKIDDANLGTSTSPVLNIINNYLQFDVVVNGQVTNGQFQLGGLSDFTQSIEGAIFGGVEVDGSVVNIGRTSQVSTSGSAWFNHEGTESPSNEILNQTIYPGGDNFTLEIDGNGTKDIPAAIINAAGQNQVNIAYKQQSPATLSLFNNFASDTTKDALDSNGLTPGSNALPTFDIINETKEELEINVRDEIAIKSDVSSNITKINLQNGAKLELLGTQVSIAEIDMENSVNSVVGLSESGGNYMLGLKHGNDEGIVEIGADNITLLSGSVFGTELNKIEKLSFRNDYRLIIQENVSMEVAGNSIEGEGTGILRYEGSNTAGSNISDVKRIELVGDAGTRVSFTGIVNLRDNANTVDENVLVSNENEASFEGKSITADKGILLNGRNAKLGFTDIGFVDAAIRVQNSGDGIVQINTGGIEVKQDIGTQEKPLGLLDLSSTAIGDTYTFAGSNYILNVNTPTGLRTFAHGTNLDATFLASNFDFLKAGVGNTLESIFPLSAVFTGNAITTATAQIRGGPWRDNEGGDFNIDPAIFRTGIMHAGDNNLTLNISGVVSAEDLSDPIINAAGQSIVNVVYDQSSPATLNLANDFSSKIVQDTFTNAGSTPGTNPLPVFNITNNTKEELEINVRNDIGIRIDPSSNITKINLQNGTKVELLGAEVDIAEIDIENSGNSVVGLSEANGTYKIGLKHGNDEGIVEIGADNIRLLSGSVFGTTDNKIEKLRFRDDYRLIVEENVSMAVAGNSIEGNGTGTLQYNGSNTVNSNISGIKCIELLGGAGTKVSFTGIVNLYDVNGVAKQNVLASDGNEASFEGQSLTAKEGILLDGKDAKVSFTDVELVDAAIEVKNAGDGIVQINTGGIEVAKDIGTPANPLGLLDFSNSVVGNVYILRGNNYALNFNAPNELRAFAQGENLNANFLANNFDFLELAGQNTLRHILPNNFVEQITETLDSLPDAFATKEDVDVLLSEENPYSSDVELVYREDPAKAAEYVDRTVTQRSTDREAIRHATMNSLGRAVDLASPYAIAAGDDVDAAQYGVWISPFLGYSKQKKDSAYAGYNMHSVGVMLGLDTKISDKSLIGGAVTIRRSRANFQDFKIRDRMQLNNFILSLYGNYEFKNNWVLSGAASYSRDFIKAYEARNPLKPDDIAKTSYRSNAWMGEVLTGYSFRPQDNLVITPMAGLGAMYWRKFDYKENGASASNKDNHARSVTQGEVIAGARLAKMINLKVFPLRLKMHGFMRYIFGDRKIKTDSQVQGTSGPLPIKIGLLENLHYNVGLDLGIPAERFDFSLKYDFYLARRYKAHQGAIKLKVNI